MSIQERNRYKKEIDILINRLNILQEQEKSYKDLSFDIDRRKTELVMLQKRKDDIDSIIKSKESLVDELIVKHKNIINDGIIIEKESTKLKNTTEKENENYIKQKNIYNNFLDKINSSIKKSNIKEEEAKEKMYKAQQEHDNAISLIKTEKGDLFEKVLNNDNIIQEQTEKIENLKTSYNNLKGDYDELDGEYQKLLENYIIKT